MKLTPILGTLILGCALSAGQETKTEAETDARAALRGPFAPELESRFAGLTYDEFRRELPSREYVDKLDFDPTEARYFDLAREELALTPQEIAAFRRNGFVHIQQSAYQTPTTAFYSIYNADLPVLLTTDAILYALHKSYDEILMELESFWLWDTMNEILAEAQAALPSEEEVKSGNALASSYRDVDLYLSVARRLLNPTVPIQSRFGQDREVAVILGKVASLKLEDPRSDRPTELYGGSRYLDYSQFKPRGHYTKSQRLQDYFRAMMWLGRADTGWNVLPVDPRSGIVSDVPREVRDAVVFVNLLQETGNVERLRKVDRVISFLVGKSDSLNVFQLAKLMGDNGVKSAADLLDPIALKKFQKVIATSEAAKQHIRSQVIVSPRSGSEVFPPATFQVFGQRFAIDSYVLSRVVFDSIFFEGEKQERYLPTGLDVMAALGNDEAVPLLEAELLQWNYGANLLAGRTFVEQQKKEFWRENLYSIWLDSLRELDADLSKEKHAPQAMRTRAWQRKQLQTQLASWSQLRHDTILYVKQSYGAMSLCEYPSGYVEPYPEFYAAIKFFAKRAGELLAATPYAGKAPGPDAEKKVIQQYKSLVTMHERQVAFFANMEKRLGQLEALARKELAAQPFTNEERDFLSKTISHYGSQPQGSGSAPAYTGWYVGLFYKDWANSSDGMLWGGEAGGQAPPRYGRSDMVAAPTIADVHTDPEERRVLEVGVGPINLCVIAIDHEDDRMVFVGPVMSYREFAQPVEQRLTDQEWAKMLFGGSAPGRMDWTSDFAVPPASEPRRAPRPQVTVHANAVLPGHMKARLKAGNEMVPVRPQRLRTVGQSAVLELTVPADPVWKKEWIEVPLTDDGLKQLQRVPTLRALDLSQSAVTDEGLANLAHLPELRSLFLSEMEIDGSGLAAVQGAPWLRRIILAQSPVTDAGVASLVSLPRLEILDLSSTKVTNGALPSLLKMGYLRELNLEGTAIDAAGLAHLRKALPKCEILPGR